VLTVTIPAGQTEVPLDILTIDDGIYENAENLTVTVVSTTGADSTIDPASNVATVEITDNEELINDTFTAKEEGSEWDNNTLVTNSPTEGYNVVGNVLTNDNTIDTIKVTSIVVAGVTHAVAQDGTDTTITTDKGTLSINDSGEFTYDVNEAYNETLNEGDTTSDTFTYIVNGDSSESADLTINIEGTDDAPVINALSGNDQALKVIDGLLDLDQDGNIDTLNPSDLLSEDRGLFFPEDNGDITINLGSGGTDMAVEYLGGQAGYHNVLGFYEYDENGNPTNPVIIYSQEGSSNGEAYEFLGTLDGLEGKVGFFIIPNAAGNVDENSNLSFDGDSLQLDGTDLAKVYYTDNNLSSDGKDHAIITQAEDGSGLIIGFEDLPQEGTDQDYDDLVIKIKPCLSENTETIQTTLLTESFETSAGAGDDEYSGWFVEHGDNGTNVYAGDNGVEWTLNTAGVEIQSGTTAGSTASDGEQHAELDPHGNGNTSMSTIVTLGSNDSYELTFDYKPRPGSEDSSDMKVSFGDVELLIDSNSNGDLVFTADNGVTYTSTQNSEGWYEIKATFSGISGTEANLIFEGQSTADTLGAFIDDIKLVGIDVVTEKAIIDNINISDVDDVNLESATVVLTNYQAGDVIEANSLPAGITASITEVNGELVVKLEGSATVATYEDAIESLTFESSSEDRSPRDFEIIVNDGSKDSNTMNLSLNIGGCTLNTYDDNSITAKVLIVDGNDSNDVIDASTGSTETATITGEVEYGDTITKLVITDGVNEFVIDPTTIVVQPNGTFTINNIDVSSLNDGELTVQLEVEDNAGNTASDDDTVQKDTKAGITIESTDISDNEISTISGTIIDVEDGQTIIVVLTDENGVSKTETVIVNGNTWEVTTDVSTLVNGNISVTASTEDKAGNKASTTDDNIGNLNDAPEIGTSTINVSEEGLPGGIEDETGVSDTTNEATLSGNISISDPDGDTVTVTLVAPTVILTSNGEAIVWSGSDTKELIGKVGNEEAIKITIDDNGAYTVSLSKPVDHPDTTVEDILSLSIGVKAYDGTVTSTGAIVVNIEDDMPASCEVVREITIEKDLVVVKNLNAGFKDSVYLGGTEQVNETNTDSDSLTDKLEWGIIAVSGHEQSGYDLIDNTDFTTSSGSEIDTNGIFELAQFTHQNWTIYQGTSTLDKTTITMNMDVIINGELVKVDFDVLLDHTETLNTNNELESRDIIILPDNDIIVNVSGQDYTFTVEGFKDANGDYVKTIYTNEAEANTFGIFASIKPTGELPEVTGTVCAEAGADGLEKVVWGDLTNPYGTMTVDEDGSYKFVVNQETKDNIEAGEDLTQSFTYTVIDNDGDNSTNTVTIKINGTEAENIAPVADDRHIELDCNTDDLSAGLRSEYYGVNTQIDNLSQFKDIVTDNNPDATFIATNINYGDGLEYTDVSTGTSLQKFLGADAASLSTDPGDTTDGGVYMFGKVYLEAGTYNFKVYGDDGYDIIIDGDSVAAIDYNQPPTLTVHNEFTITESGYHDIQMFWWDQEERHVFQAEISSDGGNTYTALDSSMLFTLEDGGSTTNAVEFTLEDFVSDLEDDASSTIVKVKLESLPTDGVLTVNGNPAQTGVEYDENANFEYTPNERTEDTLYGTTSDTGTIAEWGTIANGVLTTDDGKASITAFAGDQEIGFGTENNNYSHDGLGIGVDSTLGDDDQIDKTNDERVVITFDSVVANAEFGLASLGDHFKDSTYDAKAQWIAKDANGNVVDSGFVQQSTNDANQYTNTFKVDVAFSSIEFYTTSNASNSNFSIQYMNVDYKVDDSFDYIAIDSDGKESAIATVTFDIDTTGCTINNTAPVAIDDGQAAVIVDEVTTVFKSSFEVNLNTDDVTFVDAADGWTSINSGEKIEIRDETIQNTSGGTTYTGEAADGTKYVELNTDDSNTYPDSSGITRTVDTVAGAEYELDFNYSARPGYNAEVCTFEVAVDGVVLGTYSEDGTGLSTVNWLDDSVSFIGTGNPVEIQFREVGTSNPDAGRGMFIDDITLTQTVKTFETQGITTDENTAITVDVLSNDTDPENDVLSITHVQGQDVSNGQIVNVANVAGLILGTAQVVNGQIEFTPGEELQKLDEGENQDVVFEYTITDGEKSDSANVTINVTGINDVIPDPINASINGTNDISEGNSGWYNVQLDKAVNEDTWVTVQVYDGTAYRVDDNGWEQQNQDIMWGGYFDTRYSDGTVANIYYDQVPNSATSISYGTRPQVGPDYATWDYTVEKDGFVQYGGVISVLVKAGETESNYFEVQTWKEKITTDNNLHSSTDGNEYVETLSMAITDVSGNAIDIVDYDNSYQNVNIHDGTCVFRVSPITLDLTGDGEIGVTGETSSVDKDIDATIGATVQFDIDADGTLDTIEWIDGKGDGLLVDNRDGNAANDMDGSRLFGDEDGQYENGYEKLAQLDTNNDGQISGDELNGLSVWVDDGDAKVEDGEMKTLAELEITSISTEMNEVTGNDGKMHMESTATKADGSTIMTEDVWFGTSDIDLSSALKSVDGANIIDLEDGKANDIRIEMDDILDLTDDSNELVIKGDMEDKVDLDNSNDEWSKSSDKAEIDGTQYNVYTGTGSNSTVKIFIEDDIDVTPDI
jgi:VCBS repeat-containing protein